MDGVAAQMRVWETRLAPWTLPVVAWCAAAFPAVLPQAQPYARLAAIAIGLMAAVAAWKASTWALLGLATAGALFMPPALLLGVASYLAATTLRRPSVLPGYVVVASAVAVVPQPGEDLTSALGGAPSLVWLPLAVGLWADARRQVVAGLRERAQRLEREQTARAEQARAHERARIARDMHDIVAHRVSLMVLRAGALEVNAPDDKTAQEAELIRTTGKEALAQLRTALGILGKEGEGFHPQPTLADLDSLLEQSRSAGVPVEMREEGTTGPLPVLPQHTAYLVVREALTNIHKHAGPTATRVTLRHLPAALEVTVRNAPPVRPVPSLPGSGLGLIGLRERVELLGGEFTARAGDDGGFVVWARLPK
ncbi:sensor histidine kinase [Microbispora siamensis]|uniref:histidine kinase n=1 Tax=Microbispora siamensis TaxID=564413 RepID=A0ABQ4GJB9_9ACTN|nr:histidine kinase [Microbispora siamensis]GIH61469.1 hypothetical protein Msi02_22860 [Microbispora siamensis]